MQKKIPDHSVFVFNAAIRLQRCRIAKDVFYTKVLVNDNFRWIREDSGVV